MEFYLGNKQNKMADISNTKTPFVFATEYDLSMPIHNADWVNTKDSNILCYKPKENDLLKVWCAIYRNKELDNADLGRKMACIMKKSMHGIPEGIRTQK